MIENKLRFFFRHQIWHLGGTILLFYIGAQMIDLEGNTYAFLGISSWHLGMRQIVVRPRCMMRSRAGVQVRPHRGP